jgi:release factor glutamine methyltransferase
MILTDFLRDSVARLRRAGIDNPSLDARLLAGHALGLDRAGLLSQSRRLLNDHEIGAIGDLLARREKRESVARIIGHREFWGLDFALNEATLEPRPDSEILIEAALNTHRKARRVLDLGTGTGCLLLALLHEMPNATGLGVDLAPRAAEQATQNAKALHLAGRAVFRQGDWLEGLTEKFDIIISNPPYIAVSEIPRLMPEVREFDPIEALNGGVDGLDPYHLLIPQLPRFLNADGLAVFEVGEMQAETVAALFRANGFTKIDIYKDLGGIERAVAASL